MTYKTFLTNGGINIEKSITPLDDKQALDKIFQYIDTHKGALRCQTHCALPLLHLGFVHQIVLLQTQIMIMCI